MIRILKIISGGQSGVDRAALDFAMKNGIPCGGWCPKDRKAEDGLISEKYPLKEAPDSLYETRTKLNVQDRDGTLILFFQRMDEGTLLTFDQAQHIEKPVLTIDLFEGGEEDLQKVRSWMNFNYLEIINIAGPRESNNTGIYERAMLFLNKLLVN